MSKEEKKVEPLCEDLQHTAFKSLVTESVMVQKKAARIMYTLQDEGQDCLQISDADRVGRILANVNSLLAAVIRDIDRSRFREEV